MMKLIPILIFFILIATAPLASAQYYYRDNSLYLSDNISTDLWVNANRLNGSFLWSQLLSPPADTSGTNVLIGYTAGGGTWNTKDLFSSGGYGAMNAVQTSNSNQWLSGGANEGTADLVFNETKYNESTDLRVADNQSGQETHITNLWTNATDQDTALTNLWSNASNIESRLILEEDKNAINRTDGDAVYPLRSDWTTIDNYPASCAIGSVVQEVGDTLTCVAVGNSTYHTSTFVARADWTTNDNYPTACTNQFVSAIGDTLTCETVDISDDTNLAVTAPIVLTDDTVSVTVLKDIVASGTGMSGGADDVLTGSDEDVTITLSTAKDIVAGDGLTGGEDNVLPGADADTTMTLGAGGTVTNISTNAVSASSHTHALTLPTCAGGEFIKSDGTIIDCGTPAGSAAEEPNIKGENITGGTVDGDYLETLGDVVATSPITIDGGTNVDNILPGDDVDRTIAITVLKDIVTSAPLTGGENDVLPGADADLTLALTVAKDLVAGNGLTGGEDNVFPGADADVTLAIGSITGENVSSGTVDGDYIETLGDLVAGNGLTGGADNVFPGDDADYTIAAGTSTMGNITDWPNCGPAEFLRADAADPVCAEPSAGADLTFSDTAWIDVDGKITSNGSVNNGNTNISGNLTLNEVGANEAYIFYDDDALNVQNNGQDTARVRYQQAVNFIKQQIIDRSNKILSIVKYNTTDPNFPGVAAFQNNDGAIAFWANNDVDDYIQIATESNNPTVRVIGGSQMYLDSDATNAGIYLVADDGEKGLIQMYNETAGYPNHLQLYNTQDAPISFLANGDTGDYLQFSSDGDNTEITQIGGGNVEIHGDVSAAYTWFALPTSGNSNIGVIADDGAYLQISVANETADDNENEIDFFSSVGPINLQPNGDTSDYLQVKTASNVPTIDVIGGDKLDITSTIDVTGDVNASNTVSGVKGIFTTQVESQIYTDPDAISITSTGSAVNIVAETDVSLQAVNDINMWVSDDSDEGLNINSDGTLLNLDFWGATSFSVNVSESKVLDISQVSDDGALGLFDGTGSSLLLEKLDGAAGNISTSEGDIFLSPFDDIIMVGGGSATPSLQVNDTSVMIPQENKTLCWGSACEVCEYYNGTHQVKESPCTLAG